ncbi:thiamine-repressible mitochondrial transport protein THI74 [Achaetomium macrosporum]|uniref:Thiamine-repressible mitochondrial transport protein THI74 n=1 Tax=Achaetomium macrosporum TaxID=79813 RepID=A0AAN7H4H4_9PEZI|nr:thiamine-repressible mitochondrial transport protein THI74 [Achaetomium macrosporum]
MPSHNDARSSEPLLQDEPDRGRRSSASPPTPTPPFSTPTTPTNPATLTPHHHSPPMPNNPGATRGLLRSRSPASTVLLPTARLEARKRYTYASVFLVVSLVSFTVQTELASYIQHDLGWDKAYCMLYVTHSSWILLWPLQLAVLRAMRPEQEWTRFWEGHVRSLRAIALMVETRDVKVAGRGAYSGVGGLLEYPHSPWPYLIRTTTFVTTALTVAGLSWYLAVSMTTPSDLTAIYNCSAFFAYAFSVPLLKERLRMDKMAAVAVAIIGVLVVAYGDGGYTEGVRSGGIGESVDPAARLTGNLIIGAGSVLYGLYEVLYKRFACPPDGTDATKGVIFANAFGSLIGAFTMFVLWIPIPVLHVLGLETFEMPTGRTAWLLFISVLMNMMFSGSFLVLISLTSPVLSSVAALLTIFIVAVVDWYYTSTPLSPSTIIGGLLIIVAFSMLSWSTWREMNEEERTKQVDLSGDEDD